MMGMNGANGAVVMKNKTPEVPNMGTNTPQYEWQQDESWVEAQEIAQLEEDIRILDEEIAKCQKKKKGWTAATIIGGVGVAATGVAAIVQANKNSDKKEELQGKQQEIKSKQSEYNSLSK